MAKACVRIEKIKSMGTLRSRWNHDLDKDFRKEHVDNADASKTKDNDILLACVDEDGNEITYDSAVRKRISNINQANGKKQRKDAVKAFDIVLEFGDSDDIEAEGIDVDEWERRSLEWLKETFNVAGDGKDNVISVVCHKDEASPHIHAIVTPVDERGSLCAKSFSGGSRALSEFQTSYSKKLEDMGIERGVPNSSAHHKSNKKYKKENREFSKMPEKKPDQSIDDYANMLQLEFENRAIEYKSKIDKLERQLRARMDNERYAQQKSIESEYDTMDAARTQAEQKINEANKQYISIMEDIGSVSETDIAKIEKYKYGYQKYSELQSAIAYGQQHNPMQTELLMEMQEELLSNYNDSLKDNEHDIDSQTEEEL